MSKAEETFNCWKCSIKIGGHNKHLHEGMCDDCYFKQYFPDKIEDGNVPEKDVLGQPTKFLKGRFVCERCGREIQHEGKCFPCNYFLKRKLYLFGLRESPDYDSLHGIDPQLARMLIKNRPPQKKKESSGVTDTVVETYRILQEVHSVDDVAKARSLAVSTIYGHIAKLIMGGKVRAKDLISEEKCKVIREAVDSFKEITTLKKIRESLPEEISYGEILCVLKDMEKYRGS